mgnify:CR=1 FL=1
MIYIFGIIFSTLIVIGNSLYKLAVDAAGLTGGDWDIGAFAIQSGWTCCGDESTSKAHHLVALSAYQVTEIPVPASIVLFGSALAGLVARRRS